MSINKRKIVAYGDIEESADAKRLRYEGYNYGGQHLIPSGAEAGNNADEEPEPGTAIKEGHESIAQVSGELTEGTSRKLPLNGNGTDRQKRQDRKGDYGSRADAATGMRAFIPGLDNEDTTGDQDEETVDALTYLRSVRSEASSIPGVLIAPRPSLEVDQEEGHSDNGDTGNNSDSGYYADGAYVSAPALDPSIPDAVQSSMDAQEAYFKRLLVMFANTRQRLRTSPAVAAIAKLEPTAITSFTSSDCASKQWAYNLRAINPHPVQLASMDTDTVLRLLRMSGSKLRRRRCIEPRFSAWIWSLLARLPDVGTLSSEEVSAVRELGKRAVWIGLGWQDELVAKATEEQFDDFGEDDDSIRSETKLSPDDNTRATLCMILTIAGEVYGQRDLLEFREHWSPTESDGT